MLDLMRRHARSWLIKIALGGIIVVFVFWYGWSGPVEKSRDYAANVNGTVITYDQFRNAYETELEKIRLRFKGAIPSELLEKLNLKKNVLQALVNQTLLLQEAERLGLFVTDEDLINDIRTNPMFQRDGVFDEGIYRAYLNALKLTPTAFENVRRHELLEQQLVNLLTDSPKTSPEEIKKFWHFQNDKLILSVLILKTDSFKQDVSMDAKALESYYKQNQTKYEIPPSVKLSYVAFSWRNIQKQLSVSDDEARGYYVNHPKEFTLPERIHARHILLKLPENAEQEKTDEVLKKIENIRQRLLAGESFSDLAAKESQDEATAPKGGDLGFFSKGTMNPQLEKVAMSLEPGKISDPIRTDQGYHLLVVEEKKPESELDFDLVKEKIVQKLLEEKARKKVVSDADEFYEKVYRTEDLEAPAKQFGFEVHTIGPVSKAGGLPDIEDPKVMEEAFQLKIGEVSRLIRSGDNFIILKLLERHKERIPSLDEVRNVVEKDYLKDLAAQAAEKRASEIIEALKDSNASPEEVAKKFSFSWEDLDPVSRTAGFVSKLGSGSHIVDMLTTLSPSVTVFPNPLPTTEGFAVVRLVKIEPASEDKFQKEAQAVEKWVLEVRRTEFLKGWLKVLSEKASIDMNEKIL